VSFEVLTATSMKMAVFWDVAPCSLVEDYTVLHPKRQPSSVVNMQTCVHLNIFLLDREKCKLVSVL
jgi:hypothetical protein